MFCSPHVTTCTRSNEQKEFASLAAALLMVSSAVDSPAAHAAPEPLSSNLLERYSKVKTSEKVTGAKAVLVKKVESAKQTATNAPKSKAAASGEGGLVIRSPVRGLRGSLS